MKTFYNTISLNGEALKKENIKTAKQEELILCLFKSNPGVLLSPSMVHSVFNAKFHLNPPLTSIRRAMTNLTSRGELYKTDEMVSGLYHLPEHTWKLSLKNTPKIKVEQGNLF